MQHMYLVGRRQASSFGTIPSLDPADPSNFIHSSGAWPFSIHEIQVDSVQWCMLTEEGSQPTASLHLLIHNPVAVVQLVRCNWGSTVPEIADQLVSHGIRFHTLCKGQWPDAVESRRSPASSYSRWPKSVLGYQLSGYQADIHNLRAYEAVHDQFLHSNRGCAAVMYGGIMGRITREVVMDEDVIHGPDPDTVYHQGHCFLDTPEARYWDDELSKEEIDLMCGVYIVEKDNSTSTLTIFEASHQSWWPCPGHFDNSGLNLDFWTRDCERWFQNRVRECASCPSIMTAHRWWKAMQMQHALRGTPENNQAITAAFLDSFNENHP
ncbi:hypothetical protein PM082_015491 [Marasmius tenuissimus]|nr:hypothetical protein PM082_015491 [Marasmius tenuissimus]